MAKRAFTRHGVDASLDDIAKHAGVGAGAICNPSNSVNPSYTHSIG
ncbi:MAG: TetR family transcriptional regulator [Acidobacteriaceae bacterium]